MHGPTAGEQPVAHGPWPADDGCAARRVYAHAVDPEACLPGGRFVAEVHAELARARAAARGEEPLDRLVAQAGDTSRAARRRFQALVEHVDGEAGRRVLVRRAALSSAPLCLASGAWLQWLSAPGNADSPLVLRILALYGTDIGVGHPGASRGSAYLELLRRLRLSQNVVPLARLTSDHRIPDGAFRLPGLLLAMSRRPQDFRSELLGADLCLRAMHLAPPLALVEAVVPGTVDWTALDPASARHEDEQSALDLSREIVADLLGSEPAAGAAVRRGFGWALATAQHWCDEVYAELEASLAPAFEMAELMRLRAREGSVYHHQFQLEGRPLACWLTDSRTDPGPLLDALARSRLVKPGRSAASPLVRGLVSDRGPMFRVFSPDDLTMIRRWIDSLPTPPGARQDATTTGALPEGRGALAGVALALRAPAPGPAAQPPSLRAAYHQLMNRTVTPVLRAWCLDYLAGWLARSRHGQDRDPGPLPPVWTTEGLRTWLQVQHDRHGAEFEQNAGVPLPSREAVIDDTVQTAPLTLIDGSWLHGFTDYEQASSDIGHSLFEIYWDELGNGEARLNHPLIYREVLAEMGVELPPTASEQFARWPGFRDGSFELPVYWLCIGRFPRTFLPEVLGLNLAMELSGVGGSYRRARLALRAHGFSTRFVDIHNTIDNVATGHAAWAADAIDTWLAALPEATGPGSRAEIWQRIRVGYRSLNPPSSRAARHAARRAARRGRTAVRRR
jgi:hypothetical protein